MAAASEQIAERYKAHLPECNGSTTAAAIKALTEDIKLSTASTMMGLRDELRRAGESLRRQPDAPISIASLCECARPLPALVSRAIAAASLAPHPA